MTEHDWFKVWFRAMPADWQKGLLEALKGRSVFIGDLPAVEGHEGSLSVLFVPPAVAVQMIAAIEKANKGKWQ